MDKKLEVSFLNEEEMFDKSFKRNIIKNCEQLRGKTKMMSLKPISVIISFSNCVLYVSLICAIILQLFVVQSISLSIDGLDKQKEASLSVDYYEPVFYNPSELISQHSRKKRDIGNKESLKFNLFSKSRNFRLNLNEDRSIFHPDVLIENSNGPLIFDTSRVLSGHLEDETGSLVEGLINSEGHFDGVISTGEGQEFYVEPTSRYSNLQSNSSQGIIYESDSIQWPSEPPVCASHELHLNRKFHSSDQIPESNDSNSIRHSLSSSLPNRTISHSHSHKIPKKRSKRYVIDPKRKTCMLYLQADHLFFRHFGSEEATINMMARHIQHVNEIYRTTDFDGDGIPDGITFMIKRIKVHNMNHTTDPNYKYNGDFQVIKFLERFSEGDYESFCLAYMFTFRDFEGGTLGLAWTGDLKNAGGVCERKGHFRGGLKSLNTGIITLLNYGKIVLPAVSYVTLAHEIGHNFGSPHDPESDKECTPGGKDGNYIMYARATAGDQKNNQRFSPCSLRNIVPVLNTKARNIHGCFTEPQRGICGNREVEESEECDCGWEEDCTEPCCWPMRMRYDPKEIPCTLKPRKDCSPSQGPCCTANCTLKIGDKCRDDNGCRHTAFCDGYMSICPPSVHKPNKTVCQEEQNVCFMGECTGSICLAYGLESCQCSPQPWDSAQKMCELCCKKPGEGQSCKSSFEWNESPYDVPSLFAKPGSPCKNYTGYCDSYKLCREVDPSGPLATLRNLLLADEGLTAIAEWIDAHWYAVISFVALLIIMMVLTAKMCGKQAKKKLRKITVLHSNLEAIQVERSYWDEGGEHVIHPAAVRKKIPLRKKIREKKNKTKSRSSKNKSRTNPTGGENIPPSNNIKAPRYGTLWRKKRSERARLAATTNPNKTDISATLNGDLQSPISPANQQTFDLVQLQTPPVQSSSSNDKPMYPILASGTTALDPSQAGLSHVPSSSSRVSPMPGSSSNSPKSPPIFTTGSSSAVGDPLTAALVNHHEAKTAILPSSAGRRNKRKSSQRPRDNGQINREPRKSRSSQSQRQKNPSSRHDTHGGPSSKRNSTTPGESPSSKENKKPKKSIQIVYTPPFSLKVVQIEDSAGKSTSNPPSPGVNPLNGNTNVPNKSNSPDPAVSSSTTTIASQVPTHESNRPSSGGQKNRKEQKSTINASGSGNKSPPASTGPPPYSPTPTPTSNVENNENKSKSKSKRKSSTGEVEAGSSSHQSKPLNSHHNKVKSKVKSSGSFLQRRKSKNNEKSELRVLIPPPNQDDDEITSPVTPRN